MHFYGCLYVLNSSSVRMKVESSPDLPSGRMTEFYSHSQCVGIKGRVTSACGKVKDLCKAPFSPIRHEQICVHAFV